MTEALEDSTGKTSSWRVFTLIGVVTASIVMLMVTWQGKMTEGMMLAYIGAVVLHGAVSRNGENKAINP